MNAASAAAITHGIGRDYQYQDGEKDLDLAVQQHTARLSLVHRVMDEVDTLIGAIDDQDN